MRCILCDNESIRTLYIGKGWKITKCNKCGLVRTERKFKINDKNYHRDLEYKETEKQFENIFQKRYQIINKIISKKGRVVEIGSSTGVLLKLFKDHGWDALGIEPSGSYKEAVKKGIDVINNNFEKANLPKNKYDLVILNHTLEHMDNPLTVLKEINLILKKGGMVFIDVPNFGSLSSLIFRNKFNLLLPEEHKFHFTKESLTKLLEKSNFKIKYSETRSRLFDYSNPLLELWMSLVGFKKRFITNLITFPLSFIEKILNMGTTISIIGEK